jgi:hypothetical protein
MADWNEDIHGRKISNFINKLELKEAILSRHGTRHAPSTHIEGSTPSMISSQQEASASKEADIWHSQKELKANRQRNLRSINRRRRN